MNTFDAACECLWLMAMRCRPFFLYSNGNKQLSTHILESLANKSHTTHILNMTFINFAAVKNIEREFFFVMSRAKKRKKKLEKINCWSSVVGALRRILNMSKNYGCKIFVKVCLFF